MSTSHFGNEKHIPCNAGACHGMIGIVCWHHHCWRDLKRHNKERLQSPVTTPQTAGAEPALSHYSWQMQCRRHSPIYPRLIRHKPGDGAYGGFRCILILPTVALSDGTIFIQGICIILLSGLFGDQGWGQLPLTSPRWHWNSDMWHCYSFQSLLLIF